MYASTAQDYPQAPVPGALTLAPATGEGVESSALLERLDLESVFFNVDAALGVHTRPQFFNWTQGLLQGLVRHEVLVCAMRSGELASFRVESFSSTPTDPGAFGKLFVRDAGLMPALVKAWEDGSFRPLTLRADEGPFANTAFGREMEKIGATTLVVHGTHDVNGYAASLFTFACQPLAAEKTLSYLAQLVVPFLHAAWVRSHVPGRGVEKAMEASSSGGVLTGREREILKWIYLGKSNFEIGAILTISPLTVKNHVRKILRKLDVVNRTQAIGKALELRILNI